MPITARYLIFVLLFSNAIWGCANGQDHEIGQLAAESSAPALPELLRPAEPEALVRFAGSSNYFLREQLYFAKRHRIVKIDFGVLERDRARFTVTPFDDLVIELQATRIDRSSPGGSVLWQGTILRPALAAPEQPTNDLADTVDLAYRMAVRDVDATLARELQKAGERLPRTANSNRPGEGALKMRVMTMSAAWDHRALPSAIRIAEIEEDPRYHVIYEVDDSKLLAGPDRGERASRFLDFKNQLTAERAARP